MGNTPNRQLGSQPEDLPPSTLMWDGKL
jgi:hypothetical protein